MNNNGWVGHRSGWLVLAMTSILLAACTETKRPSAGPTGRVFAADLAGGAKTCEASKPQLSDGTSADAQMRVGNDGGWCAISVTRDNRPFDSGLLTARPTHGKVFVHKVGDTTRIDYTPDRGYAGPDSFAVKLLPGDSTVRVAVTVQAATVQAQ